MKPTLFALITLALLNTPVSAQAGKMSLDCYLDNLNDCQGCSNVKVVYDGDLKKYSMEVYNMSSGEGLDKKLAFHHLKVTEYGPDAVHGIKIRARMKRDVREATGLIVGSSAVMRIYPNPVAGARRPHIGEFHLKIAGVRLPSTKASCGTWEESK